MNHESPPQFSLTNFLALAFVAAIFALLMSKFGVANIGPWAALTSIIAILYFLGSWYVRTANAAAANDPSSPTVIESFADNYQASIVVSRLRASGINAAAVGGYTSGFQVEAPGYVDVVVPQADVSQAKKILASPVEEILQ
jgi:hypothetical protein